MIAVLISTIGVALTAGFAAGRAYQALAVPRLIARMTPQQRRALLERASQHR